MDHLRHNAICQRASCIDSSYRMLVKDCAAGAGSRHVTQLLHDWQQLHR